MYPPPDLPAWIEETQPEAWQSLSKTHGANLTKMLTERVRKNMNERGTPDVLRRGVEVTGRKQSLIMAQFKPAHALNASIMGRDQANRPRVVRQVHHSLNNDKVCMDLVLFINGLPVATAELKSDFTQSVADAVDQYRFDR